MKLGLCAFCLVLVFPAVAVHAHGVEVELLSSAPAVAVRFRYSTGEDMAYADVKVFPPSSATTEIIAGWTDRGGRFSFIPDESGRWRIEAEDGMGHKGLVTVNTADIDAPAIAGSAEEKPVSAGGAPLPMRVVFGLSLILNIFAAYNFIARRGNGTAGKKAGGYAHQ